MPPPRSPARRRVPLPRAALAALAVALVGVPAGCNRGSDSGAVPAAPDTAPVAANAVVIHGIAYHPKEIRTAVGQAVTWTWSDNGLNHSVTADAGSPDPFNSQKRGSGTWSHTFTMAGTFTYHCMVHSQMHGTVVVS